MSRPSPQAGHLKAVSSRGVRYPQSRQASSVAHELVRGPPGPPRCASLITPPLPPPDGPRGPRAVPALVLGSHGYNTPAASTQRFSRKYPDCGASSLACKVANQALPAVRGNLLSVEFLSSAPKNHRIVTPQQRFAANLRQARNKAGISQEELGHRCELHRTEISLLERAGREPRLATLIKLAGA